MNAKRREPKPGDWTYSVGVAPARLTAFERAERGLAIYYRLWDGKRNAERNKALCARIRDDDGRIVPALEVKAQEAAIARQKAIQSGDTESGPLTLPAGFRRLLHGRDGKYAADSRWKQDTARNADTIIEVLGRALLWSQVKHAHYRKLWRALAAQHRTDGSYGPRAAEVIVGTLQSTARWLQQEGLIDPGIAMPAPTWKQMLRAEWVELTERPIPAPAKPRYTADEQAKLWGALPKGDPRLHLAVEIGAELRLGQVTRSRRSDLHELPGVVAVEVHGRGKKLGEVVVLTPAQSVALTDALQGYLADLEAAFLAGKVKDYYLITGGYLARGRAQIKNADRMWERTVMRKRWQELEVLAGVEHMPGRNWYGLRRLHADIAEDVQTDARVLNKLGGWTHTHTREGYQEQGRTDIAEKARDTREMIRPPK